MSVTYAWVVQGTRGSGKGSFGVHMLSEYLEKGLKVATNFNLYLEHMPIKNKDASVIRIPDKPNGDHLYQLGQAYDFDPDDPSTFDPSQNGLMLIDEISLFLSSKKSPEYQRLNDFFMQSRKLGWNLIFICQNKDQAQDEFFKSLCDKLVICRANGLARIPYLGKLLDKVGLPAFMPDNHSAFVLSGRSELDPLEKEIKYNWRPYKLAYNTYQLFTDQVEYLNGQRVDMRAPFTYIPASYLDGSHFVNQLQYQIKHIQQTYKKGAKDMAIKSNGLDTGAKIKMLLLIVGLLVFLYFNNPMDNPLIAGDEPEPQPIAQAEPVTQSQQQNIFTQPQPQIAPEPKTDFIKQLFSQYSSRLSVVMASPEKGVHAIIDFYKGDNIVERLTSDDFHYHGYAVALAGDSAVFVQGADFKKRVTTSPVPSIPSMPQETIDTASKLQYPVSLNSD